MATKRICLWSSPRNVSTAFMYSWAQRTDTVVVDEPLYGYFLNHTKTYRPGGEEVMQTMLTDGNEVIKQVLLGSYNKPVVFFKHLTNQAVDLDCSFMNEMVNLFFIRDPKHIINSFAKVITNPTMIDIAMKMQYECFYYAKRNYYKTIVLDSAELLKNPEVVLKKLCALIEINFEDNMMHWQAGAKPYDGIWAPYWYSNVHQSTGFEKQLTTDQPLSPHLIPLYEEAKPYYNELLKHALVI